MEGVSYEAASLAAKYNLDNLIVLYDCNNVTLDGELDDEYIESVINVYESLGWNVIFVKNGDNLKEINDSEYGFAPVFQAFFEARMRQESSGKIIMPNIPKRR